MANPTIDSPLTDRMAHGSEVIRDLLLSRKTLVVVGPGGVGKTTAAAALALQASRMGRNTLVLTVDPARRLATSLGMEAFGNEPVEIEDAVFQSEGISKGNGSLSAMMLDTKSTFDALIERHAPSPRIAKRIMANPFYDQASTALAGSQEYMAMEKLYELRETDKYDLIILDTPPTSNALDFLNAPDRLEEFLGSNSLRVLLRGFRAAGKLGFGMLRLNRVLLKGLNRFIGTDTFVQLLEFIESFQEMYTGFKARAGRVREILRGNDIAFLVISSTDQISMDEANYFYRQLKDAEMPFGALLVNKVRETRLSNAALKNLSSTFTEHAYNTDALAFFPERRVKRVIKTLSAACTDYETLAQVDLQRIEAAVKLLGEDEDKLCPLPLFDRDIHHLSGLADFGDSMVKISAT